jgi:hypothetical protein
MTDLRCPHCGKVITLQVTPPIPPITATQVIRLRDRTNLPMMWCKNALEACNGDEERAVEHLRKRGLA